LCIRARLEPEAGAVVVQALAAAREAIRRRALVNDAVECSAGPQVMECSAGPRYVDGSPEAPTVEQQSADALALMAETALHGGIDPGTPGERYQVVVHVDAAVLADADAPGQSVLEGGMRVSAETSQRLACDASRVVMRHDADGQITEVGVRTRTIPPALRRALQHRDQGCRFPGCGRPFGQGHHIRHWAHGGPTTLSNLTMLCRRHHRAVHEEGYQVERHADGELCFRRPDGRLLPESPELPAVAADPVAMLRARNDAAGIHIDANTSKPWWLGERLDVGYAIDVLHPAATGERLTTTS
jgi:5-methylcytosine-specific restriction endonuclease McrA